MSASEPAPFASAYIKDGVVQHVHYARCEPCMFGAHPGGEHGWAGPEDIEHAAKTGQPDPSNERCGCDCYGGPEIVPDPPDFGLDDELDIPPCPLCGEPGACAFDADGRPMIHVDTTEAPDA